MSHRAYPYKRFSMELMRNLGYMVDDCERRVPMFGAKRPDGTPLLSSTGMPMTVSRDLFDVFDAIAVSDGLIVGVQATSSAQIPAHVRKIEAALILKPWLAAKAIIELHGWAKRGRIWACRTILWNDPTGNRPAQYFEAWRDKHGVPVIGDEE